MNQKELSQLVTELVENLKSLRSDPLDSKPEESESEVTTNALVGPTRTYRGQKTPQNDFIIDSGKAKIEQYRDTELKKRVQRARDERLQREAEQQQAETKNAETGVEVEDKLGLGEIRKRIANSFSPLAQLFLETRWNNMTNFLRRFSKRKQAILTARLFRQQAIQTRQQTPDSKDIFELERATEDIVLGRIAALTDVILREFDAVRYVRHKFIGLSEEFTYSTLARPQTPPQRPGGTNSRGAAGNNDDDDEASGTATPPNEASKRRRGEQPVKRTSRSDEAMSAARSGVLLQMLSAIDSIVTLTGMVSLKRELARFIISSIIRVNNANAVQQFQAHMNILLYGQPGTGKTTVAARVGDIFRALGLIPEPPTIGFKVASYDRSTLVAGFEGQTAIKTRQAFANNYGGMIFVDEIYTLRQGDRDEAGNEAVDTIVKLTEDYKGEVLLIGAGYEDLIQQRILRSNAGFSSRFPFKWRLPNYNALQLLNIIQRPVVPSNFGSAFERITGKNDSVRPTFVGDTKKILAELVGRAWEKNMFEDANARGAINLKRTVDDVLTQRLFLESGDKEIERTAQPNARDVYIAFAIWAKAEKDVEVFYLDEEVKKLIKE